MVSAASFVCLVIVLSSSSSSSFSLLLACKIGRTAIVSAAGNAYIEGGGRVDEDGAHADAGATVSMFFRLLDPVSSMRLAVRWLCAPSESAATVNVTVAGCTIVGTLDPPATELDIGSVLFFFVPHPFPSLPLLLFSVLLFPPCPLFLFFFLAVVIPCVC